MVCNPAGDDHPRDAGNTAPASGDKLNPNPSQEMSPWHEGFTRTGDYVAAVATVGLLILFGVVLLCYLLSTGGTR